MTRIELDDRVGFVPSFRRVSPEARGGDHALSAVARVGDAIDPLGLATILILGFPLGQRTAIQGVERLAPGHALAADRSLVELPALRPPSRTPSVDDQLELFLEACRRMLPAEPLVTMLSGGRDSRLILLGLRALGHTPEVILTVGRPGFVPDATVSQQVARQLGWEVESCTPAVFSGHGELERHRSQSLESLEHAWLGCLARHANRRCEGGPFITDGLGAGVLSTGSLVDPEAIALWKAGQLDALAHWVVGHAVGVGPRFLEAVRHAGYPVASADDVRHELVRVFRELAVWPNPLGAFSLFHWSRRGISASPFGLLSRPGRVFAPLCDGALVEALLAMDIECASRQDWRKPLIERLWGDIPPVPFASGAPRRSIGSRFRRALSGASWRMHQMQLPARIQPLVPAADADEDPVRCSFNRSAIGLLRALQSMIGPPARS